MDYDVKLYGSAVLKQPAVPVARVDDAIRQLAKDMLRAMSPSSTDRMWTS